jgi:hypothetical protein
MTRLASLLGQRWRYFGGAQVTDWMTEVSLLVATEGPTLTVSGEVDDLDFEGEDDSYSHLRVDPGAPDLPAASKAGNLFHFNAGQEVKDVVIVRETVTQQIDTQPTWTYITDIAIIFQLETAVIAFAKVSQHSELIVAIRATNTENLKIDEPTNLWTDKIGIEHMITRKFISLSADR